MKISIIGTGGVGGYFGGKLAVAGNNVTFIARGAHMKAIRDHGLKVKSIQGDFHVFPATVSDDLRDVKDSEFIIVATKAWQVESIAREISSVISTEATVLPLQNGVLAYDELSTALGNQRVLCGLCRIFSKIEAPGVITHLGIDPVILFGEADNSKTDRVLKFQALFEKAGIQSRIAHDIQAELWKKFISICVSGLLAVSRSTYGEIRENPGTRALMSELLEEIYLISQKLGIHIEPDFISKTIAFVDSFPYDSTSSLTRDVWEGKPSEVEYQNGTAVRLGEKYGIKTPVNRFIYHCILPMEKRARRGKPSY